jgi:hypothetical protein
MMLRELFSTDYLPHEECYISNSSSVVSHVVADAIITVSCHSIPVMLIIILFKKKRDVSFHGIFVMSGDSAGKDSGYTRSRGCNDVGIRLPNSDLGMARADHPGEHANSTGSTFTVHFSPARELRDPAGRRFSSAMLHAED